MRPEVWEEVGDTGLRVILALHELGGEGDFLNVASRARIGRSSWVRLMDVLKKYGLVEVSTVKGVRGLAVVMRLTEKGRRAALLLKEFESLITS